MPKGVYKHKRGYKIGKMSDAYKIKISIGRKGKCLGNKNSLGFKHSLETRKKLSLLRINNKNAKGSKRIEEQKQKLRELFSGDKNPRWKGGISKDRRTGHRYSKYRSDVFTRDNWTCQTCGIRGCYLEVHHIKEWCNYSKLRYKINNGITLCRECHKLTDNYKGKLNGIFQSNNGNSEDTGIKE